MEQETAGGRRPRPVETASAAVEGAADGLADGIEREGLGDSLPRVAGQAAPIAQRGARSERLRARLDKADEKVSRAVEATRVRARAVAESARRARRAPPHVLAGVKDAAKAYAGGLAASAGFYAAAGAVALAAAIVLTVALIQGLNGLWGKPWGTFAVGAAYGLVAFGLLGAARGKAGRGRIEAKARLEDARQELRGVAEPVREAFRRPPRPEAAAAAAAKAPPLRQGPVALDTLGAEAAATAAAATPAPPSGSAMAPLPATPVARDPGVALEDLPPPGDAPDSPSTRPTGRDAP